MSTATSGLWDPAAPRTEPVERQDGSVGWVVVHHGLDGREREEGR